ncbi:uncharacterized protein AAKU55_001884 [Oxalobacteraceae bacterium GrIS 1.11]
MGALAPGKRACCSAKITILPKAPVLINLIRARSEKRYNDALRGGRDSRFFAIYGMLAPLASAPLPLPTPPAHARPADQSKTPMKLHPSTTKQYQTVTGYDASGVEINAKHFDKSLIMLPESAPRDWDVASFDALTLEHFARILADSPDVVILGTGARQRFVHPKLTAALTMRRIGVECMDNQAACRTYNILMGEGRKVTLALIIESAVAPGASA